MHIKSAPEKNRDAVVIENRKSKKGKIQVVQGDHGQILVQEEEGEGGAAVQEEGKGGAAVEDGGSSWSFESLFKGATATEGASRR